MSGLQQFAQKYPLRRFPVGTKLFTSKESSSFYYLTRGCVKLSQVGEKGQIVNLHLFYPGACLPLLSLVTVNDTYDFEAVSEIEVYQIPHDHFVQQLRRDGELSYQLLLQVMEGMKWLLYRIHHGINLTAYQRVADILCYFLRHQESELPAAAGRAPLRVRTTHQEISEWLGLTRENVSIQLKRLEEDGLIRKGAKVIEVLDPPRLRQLAQLPAA